MTHEHIRIFVRPASDALKFDVDSLTCEGVVTGMHVEFLYAAVGDKNRPQHKILTARATFTTSDWSFDRFDLTATKTHGFMRRTTASFVKFNAGAAVDVVPPMPPLLPKLPHDVFYPFTLSSGAASTRGRGSGGVLGLVSGAALAAALSWRLAGV